MLYGIRRAGAPSTYDPATATGLTCWLRDVYTSSAGARSQWTDKSGSGNHFTASSTNMPTDNVSDAGINGRTSLLFTPANYTFMTGPVKSTLLTSASFTIYFVAKAFSPSTVTANMNSGSKSRLLMGDATAVGNSTLAFQYIHPASTDDYRMLYSGDDTGISAAGGGSTTVANSTWKRFCYIAKSSGSGNGWRQAGGGANTGANVGAGTMTRALKIGGYAASGTADANSPFDGYIAEIIICNASHTSAEQDSVFGYQATYFGL